MSISNILAANQYAPGQLMRTDTLSTLGAGVWTKPSIPARKVRIKIWPGSGSGANAYNGGNIASGGYGGEVKEYEALLSDLLATENFYVGDGAPGVFGNSRGLGGEYTQFGDAITVPGAQGGSNQFGAGNTGSTYTPTNPRPSVFTLISSEPGGVPVAWPGSPNNTTDSGAAGGGVLNNPSSPTAGGNSANAGDGGAGGPFKAAGVAGQEPAGGGGAGYWDSGAYSGKGAKGRIEIKYYA